MASNNEVTQTFSQGASNTNDVTGHRSSIPQTSGGPLSGHDRKSEQSSKLIGDDPGFKTPISDPVAPPSLKNPKKRVQTPRRMASLGNMYDESIDLTGERKSEGQQDDQLN